MSKLQFFKARNCLTFAHAHACTQRVLEKSMEYGIRVFILVPKKILKSMHMQDIEIAHGK